MTPKGTHPPNYTPDQAFHTSPAERSIGSKLVPLALFTQLGVGAGIIILNYVGALWETSNVILLVGLAFVFAGLITSTYLR